MKTHPKAPKPESINSISKRTGAARQTLRKWRDAEGLDLHDEKALQARIATRQPAGPPQDQGDDGNGETQASARRRREIALADLAEAKAKQIRGELVDVAVVRDVAAKIGSVTKAALGRLSAELPAAVEGMTASQSSKVIRDATDAILRDLSDGHPDFWSEKNLAPQIKK
jgi:hypothetical protein